MHSLVRARTRSRRIHIPDFTHYSATVRHVMRFRFVALAAACTGYWPQAVQAQPTSSIQIVEQPLGSALNELARQAGLQLTAKPDLLAGKTAPAVSGTMTVQQALDQLLAGSGLVGNVSGNAVVILPQPLTRNSGLNDKQLPTVTVSADLPPPSSTVLLPKYAGGQTAKGARLGILGNMAVVNAPFSVTSYTDQLMEEQQAQVLSDVLLNDASVRNASPTNYGYELLNIRGFYTQQGDIAFNGLYGIAPFSRIPTDMLERVEIIKGPNALLNGMSPSGAVGGTVNVVPKRAGDQPLTRLTTVYRSDSQLTAKADVSRRFGEDQALGIRFNGNLTGGDTVTDDVRNHRMLGAMAIDHRTDTTRLSLDVYANQDKVKNGVGTFAAFRGLTELPAAPQNSTNYFEGAWQNMRNRGAVLAGEVDINPNLTAYAAIGARHYKHDGYYVSRITLSATDAYTSSPFFNIGTDKALSAEAGLRGQFHTGAVKHVWGIGANSIRTRNEFHQWYGLPSTGTLNDPSPLNPGFSATSYGYLTEVRLNSLAVTDNISIAQDRLRILLGARYQQVKTDSHYDVYTSNILSGSSDDPTYSKGTVTPMLGVIVKPWEGRELSLYANYIQGLSQGGRVTDTSADNFGEVFAPFKTKQVEAGIKFDAGRWLNTLGIYQIKRPSMVSHDTASGGLVYSQDGNLRMRGVEWSTSGEVIDGLRVLGGITYAKGKYVRDSSYEGKQALATPKWRLNLGADWSVPGVPGFGVNARMIHTSSQWGDSANTLKVPAWTRWDVGARYAMKIADRDVNLRLSVENVADRNYWDFSFRSNLLSLSTPRTVVLSASVDF